MSAILHHSALQPARLRADARPPGRREGSQIRLGWPGLDPTMLCLDILIFDDSWSHAAPNGNDPVGNRYAEAIAAVTTLARWMRTGRQKIAILHFDHPRVPVVGPHRLDRRNDLQTLRAALSIPVGVVGSSELTPAMMAANHLAEQHPDHTTRCTVFSDFELTDRIAAQPCDEFRRFPGRVHAVALNAYPPDVLTGIPNVTVTRVASDDPPGMLAAALMHSLATGRRGARNPVLRGPKRSRGSASL